LPYNLRNIVVEIVALGSVFFQCFSRPFSSFHQCSILIFVYILHLPERQKGEIWEPCKKMVFRNSGCIR